MSGLWWGLGVLSGSILVSVATLTIARGSARGADVARPTAESEAARRAA